MDFNEIYDQPSSREGEPRRSIGSSKPDSVGYDERSEFPRPEITSKDEALAQAKALAGLIQNLDSKKRAGKEINEDKRNNLRIRLMDLKNEWQLTDYEIYN